ncbi:MAG: hypothetical protein KDB63_23025 [Nocardioidaceae bacterium]|nr:hypothetical protein [Nocardioidaceae bacterium]
MSEATLEVPARFSEEIQGHLTSFRDDAKRTVEKDRLGVSEDPPAYVEGERQSLPEFDRLVSQGRLQDDQNTITYRGGFDQLIVAVAFRLGDVTEELHKLAMAGPSVEQCERAEGLLEEAAWLFGAAKQLRQTNGEAVAA